MALERVGLGGVLTFDSAQAVRAAGQARDAYGRFVRTAQPMPSLFGRISQSLSRANQRMRDGARQIGRGVTSLAGAAQRAGAAMLPLTAAVGLGAQRAASFEHQMSAVSAITNGSAEDMAQLTSAARTAGIETAFSATQAGQAMEYMARSGANTAEIVGGLRGVVDAAAAEGIDLAAASDIVAQATRIMGREWGQASNTADILVRTSQRSNTNVLQLGEALRYGGQSARAAGLDLEETAGILGRLADSGLRGSVGGTALQNALSKLARPSARARELMQRYNITMARTASGGVDLANISQQLSTALQGIENPLERTNIAVEIFGQRGRRAFEALASAGEESVDSLVAELRRASEGEGAAAEAARRRLDNFQGALTLFMSSLEGVAITIFGPMLEPMKEVIQGITANLNVVLVGVQAIMEAGDNAERRFSALNTLLDQQGENTTGIVLGIVDAINDMRNAFNWARTTVTNLMTAIENALGAETIRMITRIGIILTIAAAAIGPVLVGLGSIVLLIASVGSGVIEGVAAILGVVFVPLIAAIGVLVGLFMAIRREGETTGQTLSRIWAVIRVAALRVWTNGIQPFIEGFRQGVIPVIEELSVVWDEVVAVFRETINELAAQFEQFGGDTEVNWQEVGRTAAQVLGAIATAVLRLVQFMIPIWGAVMGFYMRYLRGFYNSFYESISGAIGIVRNLVRAFQQLWSGDITGGLRTLGQAILDFLLEPIKAVVRGIVSLVDALGGEGLIDQRIRDWARAATPIVRGRGAPSGGQSDLWDALFGSGAVPEEPARPAEPTRARRERDRLGRNVANRAAAAARRRGATGSVNAEIELNDERTVDVNNEVCVDGQQLAVASQRHRTEIGERSGFRTTPWQRRIRLEQGAAPVTRD